MSYKDIHEIWFSFTNYLGRSGSGFYFEIQYQNYILYMKDACWIWFWFANSFNSYCVHGRTDGWTTRQRDRQTGRQEVGRADRRTHRRKVKNAFLSYWIYKKEVYFVYDKKVKISLHYKAVKIIVCINGKMKPYNGKNNFWIASNFFWKTIIESSS